MWIRLWDVLRCTGWQPNKLELLAKNQGDIAASWSEFVTSGSQIYSFTNKCSTQVVCCFIRSWQVHLNAIEHFHCDSFSDINWMNTPSGFFLSKVPPNPTFPDMHFKQIPPGCLEIWSSPSLEKISKPRLPFCNALHNRHRDPWLSVCELTRFLVTFGIITHVLPL